MKVGGHIVSLASSSIDGQSISEPENGPCVSAGWNFHNQPERQL